jgi:hypothetical protein
MSGSATVLDDVPGLRALHDRQAGAASRAQLRRLGVNQHDVTHQLRARRWQLPVRGVVVLYTGPPTPRTRLWIATLCGTEPIAVGSWTGLELHGLTRWERPELHVVVRRGAKPGRLPGVTVHESRRLQPDDVVEHHHGLPVLTVTRCAIDAAAWQTSPRTALGLMAAVVQQRLTTPEDLWSELERVGRVRFQGLMRRGLEDVRGGADALSEIDFARLCRENDMPEPARQARRRDSNGRTRFLDVEWELPGGGRLVVEIDGVGHMEVDRWYDDMLRDAELDWRSGDHRIRLPASAARAEPERVVAILRRHLGDLALSPGLSERG